MKKTAKRWIIGNGEGANIGEKIECEIRHVNKKLKEPNRIIKGHFGEDGFYFEDDGELSCDWDIVRWRRLK